MKARKVTLVPADSSDFKVQSWQLKQRQSLPLESKIQLTEQRIRQWYEHWNGQVYVAFSGGKDSSVLLHLVRKLYKHVPAVFSNTGLEFPEIVAFAKSKSNVIIVRPKKTFRAVLDEDGYPIISKRVSRYVWDLRRPDGVNPNTKNLRLTGMNRAGVHCSTMQLSAKWRFLVDAPFLISDKCCEHIKKGPLRRYSTETGRKPFVGTMACESHQRELVYKRTGCNAFGGAIVRSAPMSPWLEQDVLQYIRRHRLKIASVYGKIRRNGDGGLCTTGERRTGCVFCMFGVHLEKEPNRFQRLKVTHPKLWKYCVSKLGLAGVLNYLGVPYE